MKLVNNLLAGLSLALLFLPHTANAITPQFSALSQSDVDSVNREFGANSSWHSVTTPSSLGSIWGFEVGVVGGITQSTDINTLANRAQPGTDANAIPHAGLLGGLTIPAGITLEALYIPKVVVSGVDFQQYGGAIKWTLTDQVIPIPVMNIAVRGFLAKSTLAFSQNVTDANSGASVPAKVTQDSQVTGFQVLASPKLIPIIEPYIGVGYLADKGTISADVANTSLFASGVSPDSTLSSTQVLVGIEAKLLILAIGAEYERSFDKSMYTAKVSMKF